MPLFPLTRDVSVRVSFGWLFNKFRSRGVPFFPCRSKLKFHVSRKATNFENAMQNSVAVTRVFEGPLVVGRETRIPKIVGKIASQARVSAAAVDV